VDALGLELDFRTDWQQERKAAWWLLDEKKIVFQKKHSPYSPNSPQSPIDIGLKAREGKAMYPHVDKRPVHRALSPKSEGVRVKLIS